MQVKLKDARVGDIVLFKGKGLVFTILSFILCIFDSEWRRLPNKPWHTAFLAHHSKAGWQICESVREGVKLTDLTEYDSSDYRIYRWLDEVPTTRQVLDFLATHLGQRYDVTEYFFTALSYLFRHFWNRPIKYCLDERWTCWELVYFAMRTFKKPICSEYDCPMINDLCKALKV